MRIIFVVIGNSRRSGYVDGESMRSGGTGISGTDSSNILVAEYLAKEGHEVVMVVDGLEEPLKQKYKNENRHKKEGRQVNGVYYTNSKLDGIEDRKFDILVNNLWFSDYESLPVEISKGIIYWSHMQWMYAVGETIEYAKKHNLKVGVVNISEWEKQMNQGGVTRYREEFEDLINEIIPNPITDDILTEIINLNLPKKPGKFVFHASWPRGGEVAYKAFQKIKHPTKEFHAFDYLMVIGDHKEPSFFKHQGVDKKTLFKHLAEAEYFLYPLYTPYQDVHKDTFSCVVAESIALGTVPITYPLGALPENFQDYCGWCEAPDGVNFEDLQKKPLSKDLEGKFNKPDFILKKYHELEKSKELKKFVQNNGYSHIVSNFSIEKVGNMWINFLKKFT